ncbi:MAG: YdcF family protein [Ilumatobacter sp.]|nr:YdcF family protein [Ilumatobacter sp.]
MMTTRPDDERDVTAGRPDEGESADPDVDGALVAPPPRRRDWHSRNAVQEPPPPRPPLQINRDPAIPDELLERDRQVAASRDDTPTEELRRVATSWGRRALQVGMVLCALAVGYYFITLWQVYSTGRGDQARPVDAIVVMGAAQYDGRPSPQLAARLDHVAELWPAGHADLVVVTGGKRPGDRFTEAEASRGYLIERGVPAEAILLENDGATSLDSLQGVATMLEQRTGNERSSVLVVTDPYHALRSRLIAEEVGLRAYTSPTDTSVVTGARSLERHLWEAGGIAIGRITGFEWLENVTN